MNILILSHVPASNAYTAGLVLKRFAIELKKKHSVSFACVAHESITELDLAQELKGSPYLKLDQPKENGCHPTRFLKIKKLSVFISNMFSLIQVKRKILKKVNSHIKENKIDSVLVLMESMTTLEIAKQLPSSKVKLFLLCTDHISWYLDSVGVDNYFKKRAFKNYDFLVRCSEKIIVPSLEMKEMFEAFQPEKAAVISNVVESTDYCQNKTKNIVDKINIGFAGQIYARDAWESFLQALTELNWEINNKQVTIHFFGREVPRAQTPLRVLYLGFDSEESVNKTLRKMDYLYCPYPFSKHLEHVYKYSFPSKLAGYYLTGTPVIAHGPVDSSLINYSKRHQSSLMLTSIDKETVKQFLLKLDTISSDEYKEISENATSSLQRDFSRENFSNRVNQIFL